MINWKRRRGRRGEKRGGQERKGDLEKRKDQERKLEALRWWWELPRVKLAHHHITRI